MAYYGLAEAAINKQNLGEALKYTMLALKCFSKFLCSVVIHFYWNRVMVCLRWQRPRPIIIIIVYLLFRYK